MYSGIFFQERVWKLTAAAQICHRAAFASRLRLEKQNKSWKQKSVSLTLAKAVMEFWHSAGLRVENVTHNASSGADKTGQVKDVAGGFEKVCNL